VRAERLRADGSGPRPASVHAEEFYRVLTEDFGTYVGPGHWFEQSRRHFRLGFGWPTLDELRGGLAGISGALRASLTA
jgi:DNA-binding transcriptional MocR family regulator